MYISTYTYIQVHTYMYTCIYIKMYIYSQNGNLHTIIFLYCVVYRALLQKRHIIFRSLLIVATL